jgi:2-polyprenyl-6-methoxyphenol hydroxylase-like FAD-dependent oxidoreductase
LHYLLDKGMAPIPNRVYKDGIFVLAMSFHPKLEGRIAWVVSTSLAVEQEATPLSLLMGRVDDEEEWSMLQQLFAQSDPSHLQPFGETKVLDFASSLHQYGWSSSHFPCVSLVGDAAHAMRPTDGLGCSMALEDAVVLCRHLESSKIKVTEALLRFEEERLLVWPRFTPIKQKGIRHELNVGRYRPGQRNSRIGC